MTRFVRGRLAIAVAIAAAAYGAACGPAPRAPAAPDPDFLFPAPSTGELTDQQAQELRRAWSDIVAARAERGLGRLGRLPPGRPSVETAVGFANLALKRNDEARGRFARVLSTRGDYAPALMGAAAVEHREGAVDRALALYLRAQRAAPNDPVVGRRLGALKLAVAERSLAEAAQRDARGDADGAIDMLRRAVAAAPELGSARVALAERIAARGATNESISLLRSAPAPDRDVLNALARFERESGDLAAAERTLRAAAALAPDDADIAAALADVIAARDLQSLPEQLRAVRSASRVTRAELAAMIVLRVSALRDLPGATPDVASDLGRTWAREYALRAIELEVLEVYPNHTFQPNGVVRRGELARAAARVLDLVRWPASSAPPPRDMSPSHLQYRAALRVLGAGLMKPTPDGAFEPWRLVSGAEADALVLALARMTASR